MTFEIRQESLHHLKQLNQFPPGQSELNWPSVFTLPLWAQAWWDNFGEGYEPLILSVYLKEELIGIAPLKLSREGKEASLIGSPDVCDYLDFITIANQEKEHLFFQQIIEHLKDAGVQHLILDSQRPDSSVFRGLFMASHNGQIFSGIKTNFSRVDQSFVLELASDWDSYLAALKKKQRHEVRRKLRRLGEQTNSYNYRTLSEPDEVEGFLPDFIELFKENPDKQGFLTAKMNDFFKTLVKKTAREGLARFGQLEVDGKIAAAILYFDYRDTIYLYNSGYHSDYQHLSVGLLSKVLAIKDNIEKQRKIFDFLKGEEVYKKRLGGTSLPIYRVTIHLQ